MSYISTKDMHDHELKVRLTKADMDVVRAIAAKQGMPAAVLARVYLKRALSEMDLRMNRAHA